MTKTTRLRDYSHVGIKNEDRAWFSDKANERGETQWRFFKELRRLWEECENPADDE